jgi:hypothetical protein
MKETTSLESQLRSWKLRQPSARLRHRIFTAPLRKLEINLAVRWLAPAAACLLLAVATFHQHTGIPTGSSYNTATLAVLTNSQGVISYVNRDTGSPRNSSSSVTFDWTNRNGSTSSIGSFLPGQVN